MIMLHIANLFFKYKEKFVLENIDLTIDGGRTGIVGRNGSGKSTLLRLLIGELTPTQGHITRTGTTGYLAQHTLHLEHMRVMDVLGIAREMLSWKRLEQGIATEEDYTILDTNWDINSRFQRASQTMGMSGLSPHTPMHALSGGECVRVHYMRLLMHGYTHIILDEPTNHIDTNTKKALIHFMNTFTGTLIAASHDRFFLEYMDRIVEIEQGKIVVYGGNWQLYHEEKQRQRSSQEHRIEQATRISKNLERKAQVVREKQERRNAKGKKTAQHGGIPKIDLGARRDRSQNTTASLRKQQQNILDKQKIVLQQAKEQLVPCQDMKVLLPQVSHKPGSVMASMKGVHFSYVGEKDILNNINLQIIAGEKVAITGNNGSGKSTILQLLTQTLTPQVGETSITQSHAYLDQHTRILENTHTVLEAFSTYHSQTPESKKRIILAEFLFPTELLQRNINTLSGGERTRLALACLLTQEPAPALVLLDEPTNHMDIQSVQVIEKALAAYTGSILVASHDKHFLHASGCHRTIELSPSKG